MLDLWRARIIRHAPCPMLCADDDRAVREQLRETAGFFPGKTEIKLGELNRVSLFHGALRLIIEEVDGIDLIAEEFDTNGTG